MKPEWAPKESEISSTEELLTILEENPKMIIHVWAKWNGIDKLQTDETKKSELDEKNIRLRTMNVDEKEFRDTLLGWNITNVPALVFFQKGKRIRTIIGLRKSDEIHSLTKELFDQKP